MIISPLLMTTIHSQAVCVFFQMVIVLGQLQNCLCFRSIRSRELETYFFSLQRNSYLPYLYFGAQTGMETFYEKNGCQKNLQSYMIEHKRDAF